MRVALFDIDGTILVAHGAGRRAMQRALLATTGASGHAAQHYAGKTDRQIVREAMRTAGFTDADVNARMDAVLTRYLEGLAAELAAEEHKRIVALPGVPEVLDACDAHDGITLGLLTGNLAHGAEQKLRAVGVNPDRFPIGAFGSDHEDRSTLAALAQKRASAYLGRDVAAAACVVIGDTPADIACGRAIGARTIAVATGTFALEELRRCEPDVVFADLRDTAAVVEAIVRD